MRRSYHGAAGGDRTRGLSQGDGLPARPSAASAGVPDRGAHRREGPGSPRRPATTLGTLGTREHGSLLTAQILRRCGGPSEPRLTVKHFLKKQVFAGLPGVKADLQTDPILGPQVWEPGPGGHSSQQPPKVLRKGPHNPTIRKAAPTGREGTPPPPSMAVLHLLRRLPSQRL